MKTVVLCTNVFSNVSNGPAKFANLLLDANTKHPKLKIHILTEDIEDDKASPYLHKMNLPNWVKKNLFSQLFRNYYYYKHVRILNRKIQIDAILFNNIITGILTTLFYNKVTAGFINDDDSIKFDVKSKINRNWFRRVLFKILEKLGIALFPMVVTNSNYLTEILHNKYPKYKKKFFRLYKAVNLERFIHLRHQYQFVDTDSLKVLFVKNDFMRGGLYDLYDALTKLNVEAELWIVGPDDHCKTSIKDRCPSTDKLKPVWYGVQDKDKIDALLAQATVFCVPSYREALGVANIEALASGIPVIGTNVGGVPEVMNYGKNGYLVKAGDINGLSQAIDVVYQQIKANTYEQTILNGREHVISFNHEKLYENIYTIAMTLKLSNGMHSK